MLQVNERVRGNGHMLHASSPQSFCQVNEFRTLDQSMWIATTLTNVRFQLSDAHRWKVWRRGLEVTGVRLLFFATGFSSRLRSMMSIEVQRDP